MSGKSFFQFMVIVLNNRLEESDISYLMLMTSYHVKNNIHFRSQIFIGQTLDANSLI